MGYQFIACHPLTRAMIAPPIPFSSVEWVETVGGAGALKGTFTLPWKNLDVRKRLIQAVEPDESAIYVRDSNQSKYYWGGPVIDQEWNWDKGTVTVTAAEWRSWLLDVFLGPKTDLSSDNLYGWTDTDQFTIAQGIVSNAIAAGILDGRVPITIGSETSGKLRDLNIKGLDFKYVGELLDTLSRRAGGFEWDLVPDTDLVDGLPRLRLELWYPERGGLQASLLMKKTPGGSTMKINGSIKKSSLGRATRVWATGNAETLPFAVDSDPDLLTGYTLLREKVSSYPSVIERTTLASHARAERLFRSPKLSLVNVTMLTGEGSPDPTSYRAGDRGRFRMTDALYEIDLPAVRIIQRTVKPYAEAGLVDLVLNLNDSTMPEADPGGAV